MNTIALRRAMARPGMRRVLSIAHDVMLGIGLGIAIGIVGALTFALHELYSLLQ